MSLTKNRNFRIGAMLVLSFTLFIWGFNFLKGRDLLTKRNFYHAVYSNVEGLKISDAILVKGYKVGSVTDIKLDINNPEELVVRFYLTEAINLPKGTKALLTSTDLFGTKGIKLELTKNSAFYTPGDTLVSAEAKDMVQLLTEEVYPLKDQSQTLLLRADSIFTAIQFLLDTNMLINIQKSIAHLEGIADKTNQTMERNTLRIDSIISQVERTTRVIDQNKHLVSKIIKNIHDFTDTIQNSDFGSTIHNLDTTVNNIKLLTIKLNEEQGTLHKLITDKQLYDNMVRVTESLDYLLNDLQKHPSRYVNLSLWKRSKSFYYDEKGIRSILGDIENVEYLIVEKQTVAPIKITGEQFKAPEQISEFNYKGTFYYYSGKVSTFDAAMEKEKTAKKDNPNAQIIALKKGKPTKLSDLMK